MPHLRTAAPITVRPARVGLPPAVPPTLLGFGIDGEGATHLFDTATSVDEHVHLPAGYPGHDYNRWESGPNFGPAERIGDRIIMGVGPRNGAAKPALESISPDFSPGDNRVIAAGGDYLPSADGQTVWTFHRAPNDRLIGVERNPDTGGVVTRSLPLPVGAQPIAQLADGRFLTGTYTNHHGDATILKLAGRIDGHEQAVITRDASSDAPVLAAGGDTVAWQSPPACSFCRIHLTDVSTGTTRAVHWRPPYRFVCDDGALSPDARWLAVSFSCARPHAGRRGVILLVNTRTHRARLVPGSAQPTNGDPPVWSASGQWLFWVDRPGNANCRISAYHPGRRRADAFRVPCHRGFLLEALPAP